jgi:hypothetical protein
MAQQSSPATLVYSSMGSCLGVSQLTNDDGVSDCGSQTGACATGTGTYYVFGPDGGSPQAKTCTFGTGLSTGENQTGDHVDLAVSDVFLNTCTMDNPPSGFSDALGPAEAMTFVVPEAVMSPQAISWQQGYFVFGFTNADNIMSASTPWTNPADIFVRSATSGTQIIIAGEIFVPPGDFQGVSESSSGNLASALEAVTGTAQSQAIGILGIDYVEGNPGKFNILAFQGYEQTAAYYPDSVPTALDKQNVRDGHYLPVGYVHFITRDASSGTGATPNGQAVLNLVTGATTAEGFSPIDSAIKAHFVPQCAMTVTRSGDYPTAMTSYADPAPCGCYYTAQATGTAPGSCTACTTNSSCTGGATCIQGYCETVGTASSASYEQIANATTTAQTVQTTPLGSPPLLPDGGLPPIQ